LTSPAVAEVHDLRVAIRRFTQVLVLFKPCFPAKEVKRVRRPLRKTMALAGIVRDFDIAVSLLGKSRLAEAAAFRSEFRNERQKAERILAGRLQRSAKRRLFSRWRHKLLPGSPNREAGATTEQVANRVLPRLANRFLAFGDLASGAVGNLEQLHQLRIAAKKLRYTLELLAPLNEPALRGQIEQLKQLQELLGRINDAETVLEMVLQEDAGDKLSAELARKRDQNVEEFWSYWKLEFAGEANLARWRKDLTYLPPKQPVPSKPPARSEARTVLLGEQRSAIR
jgi:CHAD domain-containing protein